MTSYYDRFENELASEQDDILYEEAPRFFYDRNLAVAPDYAEPDAETPERWGQQETRQRTSRSHIVRSDLVTEQALSPRTKLLVVAFILVMAVGLLFIAMDSSRVYTARKEVEVLHSQLENARTETTVLQNELENEITLPDLYDYATSALGMSEAGKADITYLDPLKEPDTTESTESAGFHEPTRIRFHLFG